MMKTHSLAIGCVLALAGAVTWACGPWFPTQTLDDRAATLAAVPQNTFAFEAAHVSSRVGVSFISEDKACRNLDDQVPADMRLSELRNRTRGVWNSQVLSKVSAVDKNEDNLRRLYTSMYFMHLVPTNKTGENPKWNSAEPYYDDIFTLWDMVCVTAFCYPYFLPATFS
jgi:putative alpha-1,2-mannosidase